MLAEILEGWSLFQLSDIVYLLDRNASGGKKQTPGDNLLTRRIGRNDRDARTAAYITLEELDEKGIADSVAKGRLKPFKGAGYHLYEIHVGTTVWRLFVYKDPNDAFVIVLDILKGHQGKANKTAQTKAKSASMKERFDAADEIAARIRRQ